LKEKILNKFSKKSSSAPKIIYNSKIHTIVYDSLFKVSYMKQDFKVFLKKEKSESSLVFILELIDILAEIKKNQNNLQKRIEFIKKLITTCKN
jgi:hypothetical protein